MRASELYGLELRHVNFRAEEIRIEQAVCSETLEIKPTKTGDTRDIHMRPEVADAIQAQRQRLLRDQNPGFAEAGILFPTRRGKRRRSQSLHNR